MLGGMNTDKFARSTFVLYRETHRQLDYVARRLGSTRSAIIRDVLAEPVSMMERWVRALPPDFTPEDVARFIATAHADTKALSDRKLSALGSLSDV